MKKRKCLLSVSCGSFYNALSDFMVESFLKHNKGWDVKQVMDNEIHVPVVCMKDGSIHPFNACEIGRWVEMRTLLDEYDEVLYCDNDILWYAPYKPLNAGLVLSPHVLTDEAKYGCRTNLFWWGIYNEGIVYVKGDDGKKACDFIITEVARDPNNLKWDNDWFDSSRKGFIWVQDILSYLPSIGLDVKIDGNVGSNVACWNISERVLTIKDGKPVVVCGGDEKPLQSFHFSHWDSLVGVNSVVDGLVGDYKKNLEECSKREKELLGNKIIRMRGDDKGTQGLKDLITVMFDLNATGLVGAEIGSYAGESAKIFMDSGKFSKFYCIDAWENGYDESDTASYTDMRNVEEAFDARHANDSRVVKIKGFSYDVADKIEDESVDFLYIDGTHTYEGAKKDLEMYFKKVKKGGVVAGHDYHEGVWNGVIKAVDEFFGHKPEHVFCDTSWANVKE